MVGVNQQWWGGSTNNGGGSTSNGGGSTSNGGGGQPAMVGVNQQCGRCVVPYLLVLVESCL